MTPFIMTVFPLARRIVSPVICVYSFSGTPIVDTIAVRLPYTLELAGYSLILSAIIGTVLVVLFPAIRQNGIVDYSRTCVFAVFGPGGSSVL